MIIVANENLKDKKDTMTNFRATHSAQTLKRFLVSKETVVVRRWENETKIGFY